MNNTGHKPQYKTAYQKYYLSVNVLITFKFQGYSRAEEQLENTLSSTFFSTNRSQPHITMGESEGSGGATRGNKFSDICRGKTMERLVDN